jgi:hypothetical protein
VERRSARVEIVGRCIFALLVGGDESYVGCTCRSEEQEDGMEEQEGGMEEKEEEDSFLYQPSLLAPSLRVSWHQLAGWFKALSFTGRYDRIGA